jgi:hypothetical protein
MWEASGKYLVGLKAGLKVWDGMIATAPRRLCGHHGHVISSARPVSCLLLPLITNME